MYALYVKINGKLTLVKESYDFDEVNRSANYYHDQGYYTDIVRR